MTFWILLDDSLALAELLAGAGAALGPRWPSWSSTSRRRTFA